MTFQGHQEGLPSFASIMSCVRLTSSVLFGAVDLLSQRHQIQGEKKGRQDQD